ncbi:MAG: DUF4153 domain-containing protein [Bradymonadales bacterium]|jgi:hypothetical protein
MSIFQHITKSVDQLKHGLAHYKFSSAIAVVIALVIAISTQYSFSFDVQRIIEIMLLWGALSYFMESSGVKRVKSLYILQALSAAFSIAFNVLAHIDFNRYVYGRYWESIIFRLYFSIFVCAILLGIWRDFKRRNISFSRYALGLMQNLAQSFVVFCLVFLGITAVFAVFDVLILDGLGKTLEFVVIFTAIAVSGLVILNAFARDMHDTANFMRVILLYVLLPILSLAMAIIYLYIAKIIFTADYPSNVVFPILSVLFCVSYLIWLPLQAVEEENKLTKLASLLPILFAPFILLEIYSIGVRIANYGLSIQRYLAVAYIVFQIIVIWLTIFKKEKQSFALIALAAIFVFSMLFPVLNAFHASFLLHKAKFAKYAYALEDETLSQSERERAFSSYQYLKYDPEGAVWLESFEQSTLDAWDIVKAPAIEEECNYKFIEGKGPIAISGYKTLRIVEVYPKGRELILMDLELNSGENAKTEVAIPIDALHKELLKFVKSDPSDDWSFEITLDDRTTLVLYRMGYSYCWEGGEIVIRSLSGTGHFLER